jgi:hypothetical protein
MPPPLKEIASKPKARLARRILQACCASAALLISGVALLGYAFGQPTFQTWSQPPMAINTAGCIFALSLEQLLDVLMRAER